MSELSLNDLADLIFWVALILGAAISFALGFIGGTLR